MKKKPNYFFEQQITQEKFLNCQPSLQDRFIPCRKESINQVDFRISCLTKDDDSNSEEEVSINEYSKNIKTVLTNGKFQKNIKKILKFNSTQQQQPQNIFTKNNKKRFNNKADEIIEIPGFENDFYKTQFAKFNQNIALILNNNLFLFNKAQKEITQIYQAYKCEELTSVEFDNSGQSIATGNILGEIKIFDLQKSKEVFSINVHNDRIGTLSWQNQLLSGSRDTLICNSDLRIKKSVVQNYKNHNAEICKVLWSPNQQFFISGGNDLKSFAWQNNSKRPVMRNSHCSAVRALAWSPYQYGVFFTGGASNDCMLKCWNISNKELLFQRNTNSPVLDIQCSNISKELYTSHGYPDFQIKVWNNKTLKQLAKLKGHYERVLNIHLDQNELVSVSSDESLRIWKVNQKINKIKTETEFNQIKILR